MKTKKPKRPRPQMPRISEEMKQLSAMLGNELNTWPRVSTRPMFGLRGFYRGKNIFAALPVTRAIKKANSFLFRIKAMPPELLKRAENEQRIALDNAVPTGNWFAFELNSEADFRDALWWLNQAYERAK